MTRDNKARYHSESKKAYRNKLKKNKREKSKLEKLQILRSDGGKGGGGLSNHYIRSPTVEGLEISKLEHDPTSNSACTSISEEDLEQLMTSLSKDLYLKSILEDIEIDGPTVMMRYLNDTEVMWNAFVRGIDVKAS